MEVFVSSSCFKNGLIKDTVQEMIGHGLKFVELSGGTRYYDSIEDDLLAFKEEGVQFRLHNYFPPPQKSMVLNLSARGKVGDESLEHCKRAVDLSQKLGASIFGVHAGFLIDLEVSDLGNEISNDKFIDENEGYDNFCERFERLKSFSGADVKLYIENNVISGVNFKNFGNKNPFMVTDLENFEKLKALIDFELLLDVAHLKVSSQTLSLDLENELTKFWSVSDYIHVSDNDGLKDSNQGLERGYGLDGLLSQQDWNNKEVTLEVYNGIDAIKASEERIKEYANA